jgi:Protein of unknown function (DUF3134)
MSYTKTQGKTLNPNETHQSDGDKPTICYNPSLSEEPRNQPIKVIPLISRESLLGWLERTGRLKTREMDDFQEYKTTDELDDFLEPEVYAAESEEDSTD